MTDPSRRLFLTGAASLLCAPAIVRASSLMALPSRQTEIFYNEEGLKRLRETLEDEFLRRYFDQVRETIAVTYQIPKYMLFGAPQP